MQKYEHVGYSFTRVPKNSIKRTRLEKPIRADDNSVRSESDAGRTEKQSDQVHCGMHTDLVIEIVRNATTEEQIARRASTEARDGNSTLYKRAYAGSKQVAKKWSDQILRLATNVPTPEAESK